MIELGETLRARRLERDIGLATAEDDTRIRSRYLGALEEEDFASLPEGVYGRHFLQTYATYLGLDPAPLLAEYDRRMPPAEDLPVAPAGLQAAKRSGKGLKTLLVISIAALVAIAWLGVVGDDADARLPGAAGVDVGNGAAWA